MLCVAHKVWRFIRGRLNLGLYRVERAGIERTVPLTKNLPIFAHFGLDISIYLLHRDTPVSFSRGPDRSKTTAS